MQDLRLEHNSEREVSLQLCIISLYSQGLFKMSQVCAQSIAANQIEVCGARCFPLTAEPQSAVEASGSDLIEELIGFDVWSEAMFLTR